MPSHRDIFTAFDHLAHDGHLLHKVCKDIDGYPGVEGTHVLVGARAMKFLYLRERQIFYEPLSNYDQLLKATLLNVRLINGHVPRWAMNRLMVAFRMFESIYSASEGKVLLPTPGDVEKGLHAVAVDGGFADAGETLRFANSWGVGWGDKGYGLLSREYLERYMSDAWLGRNARVGPSRFLYRRFATAMSDKEFARTWMTQNPRQRIRFQRSGRSHALHVYETWSLSDDCWVQVIELRNGFGLRLGWAHLHHISRQQPRVSILKELFVWPWYRRRGYGTLLESFACAQAKRWRSTCVRVLFHECDALPRNRVAGRLLGKKAGYEWKWTKQRHPNLAAIGEKSL